MDKNEWNGYERAYRHEAIMRACVKPDNLCTYGIKCLDDSLIKIGKTELVVIGAETGSGKSELALSIGQHNAKNGRRVGIYFLEGGAEEAIRRMKWRDMCLKYKKDYHNVYIDLDYTKWMYNIDVHPTLTKIEGEVYNENRAIYEEKLFLYNRGDEFTIDTFLTSLLDFHQLLTNDLDMDLMIIDHLQFFSLTQAENEIQEITKILRAVDTMVQRFKVPVILVSHLRKRGKKTGLPTQEDFYGSSNIPKISSTSILISPSTDKDNLSTNTFPTYFRVAKSRVGVRSNIVMMTDFDLTSRVYKKEYGVYRVDSQGFVATEPLTIGEKPRWAR